MNRNFKNPFRRPWLENDGAAVAGPPTSTNKSLKGIVAGGITGGIEISITYPTEYIKTQLQLDEKGAKKEFQGVMDCFKKTVNKHGILGLYRGLSILIYGSIPKAAVRFGGFETFKTHLADENGNITPSQRFLCGMGAGICEAFFAVTPMETVKVKFINDRRSANPRYKGFVHGVKLIIKENGFRGLYSGLTATVLKQGSNQGMRFFCMETLKDIYRGGDNNVKVPKYLVGLFGSIAGGISVFGNAPIDVIKTRMQGLESARYKNTLDCAVQIVKNEGPLALYKGTGPRLFRVMLDVAITFMIYDSFMDLFNKIWP